MKKQYVAPQMECVEIQEELPLCVSGVGGTGASGSVDLGFGGLDELGGLDPYIKERLGMDEVLKDFDPMGPLGW